MKTRRGSRQKKRSEDRYEGKSRKKKDVGKKHEKENKRDIQR